ncbi:MAG: hypothetical protein ABEJ07_05355 [Candidatus Nanohaloarchaea archaeon]
MDKKYYRPSLSQELRKAIEEFIEEHPEYGFESPKEFITYSVRRMIDDNQNLSSKEMAEALNLDEKL